MAGVTLCLLSGMIALATKYPAQNVRAHNPYKELCYFEFFAEKRGNQKPHKFDSPFRHE